MAHAAPRCADHLGERLVANLSGNCLWATLFPKISQQQQETRKALFSGIEELIHQALFNARVSCKNMGNEHLRKSKLIVKNPLTFLFSTLIVSLSTIADARLVHIERRIDQNVSGVQTAHEKDARCSGQKEYQWPVHSR
jgi:hypothetical protein